MTSSWLEQHAQMAKLKQRSAAATGAASAASGAPLFEPDRDGVFYDRAHASFESRQGNGRLALPVSGERFFNKKNNCIEVYGDIRRPPETSLPYVAPQPPPPRGVRSNAAHASAASKLGAVPVNKYLKS